MFGWAVLIRPKCFRARESLIGKIFAGLLFSIRVVKTVHAELSGTRSDGRELSVNYFKVNS